MEGLGNTENTTTMINTTTMTTIITMIVVTAATTELAGGFTLSILGEVGMLPLRKDN